MLLIPVLISPLVVADCPDCTSILVEETLIAAWSPLHRVEQCGELSAARRRENIAPDQYNTDLKHILTVVQYLTT